MRISGAVGRELSTAGAGAAWLRIPLIIVLGWWTLRGATAQEFWCFLDFVNLPFHESGHLLFSLFGQTLHILGGTLGQLLVPAILCIYFLLSTGKRQPFASAVCLWWFGENFINIARYMADARDLALPLVGGGDHDWNELFYRWNLLTEPSVARVSTVTHHFGVVVMLLGLAWCGTLLLPASARESIVGGLVDRWPVLAALFD